tara:strand:- start:145 stop:603 length:459 start_codon:yes stop_codon:yes gene_type:complete
MNWYTIFGIIFVIGAIIGLIVFLNINYRENLLPYDPKIDELKKKLTLVHPESKKLQFLHDKKSYTINKKKIHLCIKDENGQYYNDNMLVYVSLHELAHVLCDEVGHTPKFWAMFDALLEEAERIIDPVTNKPVYDPKGKIDTEYCDSDYHNS